MERIGVCPKRRWNSHTTGLLGVIIEVCLCVHIGVVADDLDGVLVGAYGTVCSQTPELAVGGSLRSRYRILFYFQRKVGHIIDDTDGKSVFLGVVVYGNDLSRSGILGTQSVTAASDRHLIELGASVQLRHPGTAALREIPAPGSVKDGDSLNGIRNSLDEASFTNGRYRRTLQRRPSRLFAIR